MLEPTLREFYNYSDLKIDLSVEDIYEKVLLVFGLAEQFWSTLSPTIPSSSVFEMVELLSLDSMYERFYLGRVELLDIYREFCSRKPPILLSVSWFPVVHEGEYVFPTGIIDFVKSLSDRDSVKSVDIESAWALTISRSINDFMPLKDRFSLYAVHRQRIEM